MLSFLPGFIRCALSLLIYIANSVVLVSPLLFFAVLKLLIPFHFWQYLSRVIMDMISTLWVRINSFNLWLMHKIEINVNGGENLCQDKWYIVISNHQSWVDILVMQKVLLGKIPFLKFFLKKELIWVPVMGLAWWALDFPFMKRYSRAFLEKNPHLKGKDIEITRKACEKFKTIPVSIVNYVEGTRYSPEKHKRQNSPFTHLLKPKAGGIGFVLGSMGEMMTGIVNVTIAYPEGAKNFWQFLSGQLTRVDITIETIPVTEDLLGDYFADDGYRGYIQSWINALWTEKDEQLSLILRDATAQVN